MSKFWLMKSEPDVFSIEDLEKKSPLGEHWDGVRNYQARNFMREMKAGDLAFFYHSNAKPSGIAGIMKIVREAYPDHTAVDQSSKYFDPKADPENPRWYMVDVVFVSKFSRVISLQELKSLSELKDLPLVQKGSRLSIMPVESIHWDIILKLDKTQQFEV